MTPRSEERVAANKRSDRSNLIDVPHIVSYGTDRMIDFDPIPPRPSVYRRKSFIEEFAHANGAPQIILLMLLFAFAFGSVIGVVPAIMSDRYARIEHGWEGDSCSSFAPKDLPQACLQGSSDAQNAVAIEQFVSNGLTFFTSSLVGSLSDECGRKRILLLGVFLSTLSPLFLLLVQLDHKMSPIWYYTVGALQGLVNWIAIALSALSDVMPQKWRAPSFGLVMAGFSVGFALAPQLALLLGHFRVTVMSISIVLLAFFMVLIFFPETLPEEAAERAKMTREMELNELETKKEKAWWYISRPARELSILNRNRLFRLLSVLAFVSGISSSGSQSLFLYYVEERIGFDDSDVATYFMVVGFCGIFVQGVILKILNDFIGERRLLIFCFLIGAIHDTMYATARTKFVIFLGGALASLVIMAFPTISAIKSNNVDKTEQGRIQGALYSVQALASAAGPTIFRFVADACKHTVFGTGAMFLVATVMYLAATVCAYLLPPEADSRRLSSNSVHSEGNTESSRPNSEEQTSESGVDTPLL